MSRRPPVGPILSWGRSLALLPGLMHGPVASAGGGQLGLEAGGAMRDYDFDSEWSRYQERIFEESLHAEYNAWLVDKAIASYHLGLTLGSTQLTTAASGITRPTEYQYLQTDYDARADIWHDGLLPLSLYARHDTVNIGQGDTPVQRAVNRTTGYTAALIPHTGPRLRSHGFLQDTRIDNSEGSNDERRWELGGDLSQYTGRLNGRASLKREGLSGDIFDQDRLIDTARIDTSYRMADDLSVSSRFLSRSYRTDFQTTDYRARTDDAFAHLRWTPTDRLLGTATGQATHRNYQGDDVSTESAGVSFGVPQGEVWSAVGSAGVERSSYDDADDSYQFMGEYINALVVNQQQGDHGTVRLETTGGIADFTEVGVGSGMQQGARTHLVGYRFIGGSALRLLAGAQYGRQWDSSPRQQDYIRRGWEAGMEAHPFRGITAYARASQIINEQLSQDEGDSDTFNLYGTMRLMVSRDLSLEYGLNQSRMTLDDNFSATLGQSARARVRLSSSLSASAAGYRYIFENDKTDPWWWNRAEAALRFEQGLTMLRGRVAVDINSGDTTDTRATYVYAELRRRWRWGR